MTTVDAPPSIVARARALGLVLVLSFRADPIRATASFVLTILEGVAYALPALGLKVLLDAAERGSTSQAMTGAVLIVVSRGLGVVANWSGFMIRVTLRERTDMLIDLSILELTLSIPGLEHLERPDYADRVQLLRQQRSALSFAMDAVVQNLRIIVEAVATLALFATIHPVLIALPIGGIPAVVAAMKSEQWWRTTEEELAESFRTRAHYFSLATTPAAGKEVRVFGLGPLLLGRYGSLNARLNHRLSRLELRVAIVNAAGWAVFAGAFVLALLFVVDRSVRDSGSTQADDVIMAIVLAGRMISLVSGARSITAWLARTSVAAGRYAWLTDYAKSFDRGRDRGAVREVPARLQRGIDFADVSFTYPGTDVEVISDVNVRLPAGSVIAIVGDNGAGKSTIVKLLSGFYRPTRGQILVDELDLAEFDLDQWRARMSAAFQDHARFELLARESVGVGQLSDLDYADAIDAALHRAGAEALPSELPSGLETQLGRSFDEGVELSGGQWQKIALGRTMMRNAPLLLVLDEPTSALDPLSEHALFARYAEAAKRVAEGTGSITILVSHRFSTVRMADLILVVDQGRLLEVGTHSQLMSTAGVYAELYELQAHGYR